MSTPHYRISPAIGIGRLGNSPTDFYLAPTSIGGLPTECDANGNPVLDADGAPTPVARFKDAQGRVKRQAARFTIVAETPAPTGGAPKSREVNLSDPNIASIQWTVHVANKKAAWYNYSPLRGNLQFGPGNSYKNQQIPLRNASVKGEALRQKLIIDPGPRTLDKPGTRAAFDANTDYPFVSFPSRPTQGLPIKTLGDMLLDDEGNLLVLGGYGSAGGDTSIQSFAGADTWHDDISDGQVTAVIRFKDGSAAVTLQAWVLIGSPKFAPELVNISTLADVMADTAVRYMGAKPDVYDVKKARWNRNYVVNYDLDIQPFLRRFADYQWVGNMQSMNYFVNPPFDPRDASAATAVQREQFLGYFRRPGQPIQYVPDKQHDDDIQGNPNLQGHPAYSGGQENQLFSGPGAGEGIPLMPLNSGSNSVSDSLIDKFATLTPLQYFFLEQWAAGYSDPKAPGFALAGVSEADWAGVGNCVGEPMCPGIETTWNVRNASIYSAPLTIRVAHDNDYYRKHGLDCDRDETRPDADGCEPGDLTKRMAVPWQSDFFQCSVQFINFTDPQINKDPIQGIPVPPTYYAYWWPPQSPWNVITGAMSKEEQRLAGVPAGLQVLYSRGINAFDQMVMYWHYLGFVLNQNQDAVSGRLYPYFVEKERNHDRFQAASVAVGRASDFVSADNVNFLPVWYLCDEPNQVETLGDKLLRVFSMDTSTLQRNTRLLE